MNKKTENSLYQFAHSEYFHAVKDWFNEIIKENDMLTRSIDPNKEPHKISKLAGGTETVLSILHQLNQMNGGEDKL